MKRISFLLFLVAVLTGHQISASTIVVGNAGSTDITFTQPVLSKTYSEATGTLYLGLTAGAGQFAISKVSRYKSGLYYQFTPLTTSSSAPFVSLSVYFLAIAARIGDTSPNIASASAASGSQPLTVNLSNAAGTINTTSANLLDASGAVNSNGSTTSGVVALAGSADYLFASVAPNGGTFGQLNSGIALICIHPITLALEQVAAVPSDTGVKAARLDPSSPQVFIVNQPTISPATTLFWDARLQRLYSGLNVTTASSAGSGARSIVVGRVEFLSKLILQEFAPAAAFVAGDANNLIGYVTAGGTQQLFTTSIHTMHASTGPTYLIGQGGIPTANPNTGNNNVIFALPLVDVGDPTNPTQGLLANKNSFNTSTHRYETAAAVNADLVDVTTDAFALVGGGPAPITATQKISDVVVVGDAVFIALDEAPDFNNDSGVLYSEAIFNEFGQITRWTPWTKRAFPYPAFPEKLCAGFPVLFTAVDALTGQVWAVDGDDRNTVRITTWESHTIDPTTLLYQLNKELSCGCYSVLDLDQSTRGFLNATQKRYALFGGCNEVAFALTSTAENISSVNAPQQATLDYSDPRNIRFTTLFFNGGCCPNQYTTGCVQTLEYSRQLPGSPSNFFFAGTPVGLFVFADDLGNGFDSATLASLNAPPFTTFSWQRVGAFNYGNIVQIITLGNALYVLTTNRGGNKLPVSQVWKINFTNNVKTMFAASNISLLAESGTAPVFGNTFLFTGMQLVATNASGTSEQLLLTTNVGLFRSSTVGGVQTATSQTNAAWQRVNSFDDTISFNTIAAPDNATFNNASFVTTVWPAALVDDPRWHRRTFDRGSIFQVSGTTDTGAYNFVPNPFNGNSPIQPLPPITRFWSDGGRRFFILKTPCCGCAPRGNLLVMPYDTEAWAVDNPDQFIITDIALRDIQSFFWVKQIGSSGILLTGTNQGVAALQ